MDCQKIRELLEAYALDALEADEWAVVEQHLVSCPDCQRLANELKDVASLLPQALAEASALRPPAAMKQRLLQALDAETPADRPVVDNKPVRDPQPVVSPPSPPGSINGKSNNPLLGRFARPGLWGQRSRPVSVLALSILLIVSIFLGARLTIVLAKERALQAELASLFGQQELVLEVVDSDQTVKRILLAPEPRRSQPLPPYGKLYTRSDLPHVVAMVARLPHPPEGQAYHLWLTRQGRLELAGQMEVNEQGFSLLTFDADSDGPVYESAQLWLQPPGGAEPAGELILSWEAAE